MDLKVLEQEMCQILRHTALTHKLAVDSSGFCELDDLVFILRAAHPIERSALTVEDLIKLSIQNRRYEVNNSFIRARYGHSFLHIQYQPTIPPERLYHGTTTSTLPLIYQEGIRPMNRTYVYLANQEYIAKQFAKASNDTPAIIEINTKRALANHAKFFNVNDGIWLCAFVHPNWIVS